MTSESSVEIIYPVSIGIYAYLIGMLIKGISYVQFTKRIRKSIDNPQYDLQPTTAMQQAVSDVIGAIHNSYIKQIHMNKVEQESQNRFLSQWIHNLKTPISVIDLTTQQQVTYTTDATEMIHSISEENQKLYHNVEQLLSLIRLENFTKDYVPEEIDLKEEIKKVINGLKNQFVTNHVFPELNIMGEEMYIFSDKKWHNMMLEQFVSNAIKYSKKTAESKRIWITLQKDDKGLCLSIKDEGIGIPEYDLNRIFEPFFTGDNGRENSNATGIGLYIANTIANKLGHGLEVSSSVGLGTTILIHYNIR